MSLLESDEQSPTVLICCDGNGGDGDVDVIAVREALFGLVDVLRERKLEFMVAACGDSVPGLISNRTGEPVQAVPLSDLPWVVEALRPRMVVLMGGGSRLAAALSMVEAALPDVLIYPVASTGKPMQDALRRISDSHKLWLSAELEEKLREELVYDSLFRKLIDGLPLIEALS